MLDPVSLEANPLLHEARVDLNKVGHLLVVDIASSLDGLRGSKRVWPMLSEQKCIGRESNPGLAESIVS